MSPHSSLYAAGAADAAEVRRVLRLCLAGMLPPAALCYADGDFYIWTKRVFVPAILPHITRAHELCATGDDAGLAAADLALAWPPESVAAGRVLLASRADAWPLPIAKRFRAAVAAGQAAGHFATVMALYAAGFSIALVPLIQAVLYCEWRGGQNAGVTLDDFPGIPAGLLPAPPGSIFSHAASTAIPVARTR